MTIDARRRWDDPEAPAFTIRELIKEHDRDIESLKAWRSELRGALMLVKFTLGASLVSGAIATVTLIALVANAIRG